MLNGAGGMDGALLFLAGNKTCPQPQTSEHLAAVESMRLKNIIILQNKVDLAKMPRRPRSWYAVYAMLNGIFQPDFFAYPRTIEEVCEHRHWPGGSESHFCTDAESS